MLEDPPYNLIVAVTACDPKDWCAELPLPSHLLCFERIKNADIMFNQFINRLQADGITVKTDKAFRAQPHEVIRVFNQIRDEAFNSQQATKEIIDLEKREGAHEQAKEITAASNTPVEIEYQRVLTTNVFTPTPLLAAQQHIGKFTVQDGIAEDTETGLMWLRFTYGQTWQNGTAVGDVKRSNWNMAFEMARQFNQQGGYADYSDWRLPTIDELKTLIDQVKGNSGNFIDTDIFPENTQYYWSSSPNARNNDSACCLNFYNGSGSCDVYKGNSFAARLVRGHTIDKPTINQIHSTAKTKFTPTTKTPSTSLLLARQQLIATLKARISETSSIVLRQSIGKFTVQDGIAEDTETGLMWLRFAHGQTWQHGVVVAEAEKVNWNKAFEIAKQLNLQGGYAGNSDWRLPTADELKSLIDKVKGNPGNFIDLDVFPKNAPWFWSSSSYAGSSFNACFVDFTNGFGNCVSKSSSGAIRFVRGNRIDEPVDNQIHSATKAR
jgi:hypothetical protein